jgi:hypothetical protein
MRGSHLRRSHRAHLEALLILSIASAVVGPACGGKADTDRVNPDQSRTPLAPASAGSDPPSRVASTSRTCGAPPADALPPCTALCIDGQWVPLDADCTPDPLTDCPASPAEIGSDCASYAGGLSCDYAYCSGTVPMRRCSESTALWEPLPIPPCDGSPGTACELTLPVAGSDCAVAGVDCAYRSECTATCLGGQWLVVLYGNANCDPVPIVPVCPERELVTGDGCAYELQECAREACTPGAESRAGHLCSAGVWQDTVISCAPDGGG